jgi:hypothetical protein
MILLSASNRWRTKSFAWAGGHFSCLPSQSDWESCRQHPTHTTTHPCRESAFVDLGYPRSLPMAYNASGSQNARTEPEGWPSNPCGPSWDVAKEQRWFQSRERSTKTAGIMARVSLVRRLPRPGQASRTPRPPLPLPDQRSICIGRGRKSRAGFSGCHCHLDHLSTAAYRWQGTSANLA